MFLAVFCRNEYFSEALRVVFEKEFCGKKLHFKSHDLDASAFTKVKTTPEIPAENSCCFVSCVQKGSVTGLFHFLNVLTSIGKSW